MGHSKPLTIQGNVNKIVTLYENEALELEETEKLLKQFSKDDLIECLLGIELDEEKVEDPEANKRFDEDQVKSKVILKKTKDKELDDLDFDEDQEEDDDLDL